MQRLSRLLQVVLMVMAFAAAAGCASGPSRAEWLAANRLQEQVVQTERFPLWVVGNEAFQSRSGHRLLVLIEGDGTPWLRRRFVASDPTSSDPLLLPILAEIESATLYLGRPCYYRAELESLGQEHTSECEPDWWTFGRYSEPVVASLV